MAKAKKQTASSKVTSKTAAAGAPKSPAPSPSSLRGIPLKLRAIVALFGQTTDAEQLRRVGLVPPENGRTGITRSKIDGLTALMSARRLTEVRLTQEYKAPLPYRLAWRYPYIWIAERLLRAKAKAEKRRGADYRIIRKLIDPQSGLTFEWTMNRSENTRTAKFFVDTGIHRRRAGRAPRGADPRWSWKRWVISAD